MLKKLPEFRYDDCISCKICVQICPFACLEMTRIGKQGKYVNVFPERKGEGCLGCGQCAAACPMNCIDMKEQP